MIRPSQTVIDDIVTLHQHCIPVADIARKLHLPESTVVYVIEHGELPEPQPAWQPSVEA